MILLRRLARVIRYVLSPLWASKGHRLWERVAGNRELSGSPTFDLPIKRPPSRRYRFRLVTGCRPISWFDHGPQSDRKFRLLRKNFVDPTLVSGIIACNPPYAAPPHNPGHLVEDHWMHEPSLCMPCFGPRVWKHQKSAPNRTVRKLTDQCSRITCVYS